MQITDVECLVDCKNEIGEGPVWNVEEQALYWVDCPGRVLQRWTPAARAMETFALTKMPGSYAFRRNAGGIVMAFRNALGFVDFAAGREQYVDAPVVEFAKERFNDGKCDRAGRFWTGTMDREGKNPVGSLYRVDPDMTVTKMDTGITASNGIAWSPDNATMYYCDSRAGVYAYDYDLGTGAIANRRMHLDLIPQGSHPDGCTVDAEGFLWVAEPGSSCVRRYDPKGRREREVRLPVTRPASCMFGGDDLSTLFITTLRYRLSPEELADQPLAGGLFKAEPGVKGLPEPRFAG